MYVHVVCSLFFHIVYLGLQRLVLFNNFNTFLTINMYVHILLFFSLFLLQIEYDLCL